MMTEYSAPAPPPFIRFGPSVPTTPLVITVPHAGRHYPAAIEKDRAVAMRVLEDLEDRYADRLVGPIVATGAVAIVATHARAWIDLNRGREDAFESEAPGASPRAQAGLGLVPSRIGGRALWRPFPSVADIDGRIAALHAPYHMAIGEAVAAAKARYGVALLVDCHSMPPLGRLGRPGAQIVIGDRYGASASLAIVEAAESACVRHALSVTRNAPYAGAYTIQRHGRPLENVHAIQVEIDRSLYLQAGLREPSRRMSEIAEYFAALCRDALDAVPAPYAKAAE